MSNPKYVNDCLASLLALLDPKHPGFRGSSAIGRSLAENPLKAYLETWVLPVVKCAAGQEGFEFVRQSAAIEAHAARTALLDARAVARVKPEKRCAMCKDSALQCPDCFHEDTYGTGYNHGASK